MSTDTTVERVLDSTWWLGPRAAAAFPIVFSVGGYYYLVTREFVGLFVSMVVLGVAITCLVANFALRIATEKRGTGTDEPRSITEITEK